jgi:hypothetical protein
MSIRRFTNPHLVIQELQTISRADIYAENERPRVSPEDVETLQSLLRETIPPLKEDGPLARPKRRKETKSIVCMYPFYLGEHG